jgi:hypothetical protein
MLESVAVLTRKKNRRSRGSFLDRVGVACCFFSVDTAPSLPPAYDVFLAGPSPSRCWPLRLADDEREGGLVGSSCRFFCFEYRFGSMSPSSSSGVRWWSVTFLLAAAAWSRVLMAGEELTSLRISSARCRCAAQRRDPGPLLQASHGGEGQEEILACVCSFADR